MGNIMLGSTPLIQTGGKESVIVHVAFLQNVTHPLKITNSTTGEVYINEIISESAIVEIPIGAEITVTVGSLVKNYTFSQYGSRKIFLDLSEIPVNVSVDEGLWTATSNSSAKNGYNCTNNAIGDNGITTMKITVTGIKTLVLNLRHNGGESGCDYPVIGYVDSNLTTSLDTHQYEQSISESTENYTITFPDSGSHYIMIGYIKDKSVTKFPDNATVYIEDYTNWV